MQIHAEGVKSQFIGTLGFGSEKWKNGGEAKKCRKIISQL